MTVSPGTPTFTPPAHSVPAFTAGSVAVGATITTVKLESSAGSAQTNVPFRFGQVFKSGEIAASSFMVGKIAGQADVPLQFNALATWPDGSVRHATISCVLPTMAAGTTVDMALVRASSGASTTAIAPASFSSLLAKALLNFGGTAYTADAGPAIAALSASAARIAGSIATEYNVTLSPVTAGGTPHPDLQVKFDAIYFPGANAFKVDVTFEHCRAFSTTGDLSYSGTIQIGGATVYTLPNPLVHHPHRRWKRTYWQNNAAPVVPRQNRDYFIDSKAVVNYDRRVTVTEATLAAYVTQVNDPAFAPMGNGIFTKSMSGVGGRPDIGLLPGYAAATVLSMDKRAIALTKACGEIGGSWGIHYRDTSTGPGAGMPLSIVNWPYATGILSAADVNPSTGQNEFIPTPTTASDLYAEDSHTPNFAYLPYLLTGDLFFLEEMQFWTCGILAGWNYYYRQKEKGIIQTTQARGQAWQMRGIMENAAVCPDAHPLKSHFKYWLDSNIALYDAMYTNNPAATPLGCLSDTANYDVAYDIGNPKTGVGLYMDDFFTSVIGHAVELGFASALPLLRWKAKFQIGRMTAPGFCPIATACTISLRIKDVHDGPTYNTLAECAAGSVGMFSGSDLNYYTQAIHDAPCGSQQQLDAINAGKAGSPAVLGEIIGYSGSTEGYVANLQPGLALAVDSGIANGDAAWNKFDSRAVKPDYGTSPQFAVVPRGVIASTPTTPTTPTDPTPDPQPIVRKVMSFDRVNTTTTSTGTGTMTVSSTATRRYLPLSSIPIGTLVALVIEDENGDDWEESYCTVLSATTFSRDTVIKGSNGASKVNFGAGTKTVFATLTADQINAFLTASSLTGAPAVTTVADPTAVSLLTNIGGVVKQITAANFLASVGVTAAQLPAVTAANIAGSNILGINQPTGDGGAPVDEMYTYLVNRMTAAGLFSGSTGGTTPAETLAINAITSPQTVGAAFTVSGTWANVQPTALNYAIADNGGALGAYNTAAGATINVNGTWSFSVNPATASTSRMMVVQDAGHTNVVSPASNAYAVNAAAASPTVPAAPTIGTAVAGDGYVDVYFTHNSNGGAAIIDSTATLSTGQSATGTTSPIRVTAPNGTAVTATVKDRNSAGSSAASAASNSVTPAAGAVAYTYTQQFGQVIPSTYNATGNTTYTGGDGFQYRQIGGDNAGNHYWNIKKTSDGTTNAPSAVSGWSTSPTERPTSGNAVGVNGYLAMTGTFNNESILYVKSGTTGTFYFHIKPSDGDWYCPNPSGMTVTA